MTPKNPGGGTGGPGTPSPKKPSQQHGGINAGAGVSSATKAAKAAATAGQPAGGGSGTPAGKSKGNNNQQQQQGKKPMPPKPTAPPKPEDIHHSEASRTHIIPGEGGKQGGHLAGTGLSTKTEFPVSWDEAKIMDASLQVTQMGPPVSGPHALKDANKNPAWGYNYEGMVDGVLVRTTVLSTGEIRTSFPPDPGNPGVILNPPAPSPAPQGIPVGVAPRYSHPDVNNGNGSWTWEGPKGDKMIRVVQDAQGNVTTTELGPYKKK